MLLKGHDRDEVWRLTLAQRVFRMSNDAARKALRKIVVAERQLVRNLFAIERGVTIGDGDRLRTVRSSVARDLTLELCRPLTDAQRRRLGGNGLRRRRLELPAEGLRCYGVDAEVIALVGDTDGCARTQLVLLPELHALELDWAWSVWPPSSRICGTTGDDRKIIHGPDGFYLVEPNAPAPVLLHAGFRHAEVADDTLWVLHHDAENPLEASPSDRSIVAAALDGSPPVTVVPPPFTTFMPLSAGRWALQRVEGSGRSTAVRVLDSATGHEEVVAEDVDVGSLGWNRTGSPSDARAVRLRPADDDDTILFACTTDDRTEVWRVVP